MTKEDFLNELRRELRGLSLVEIDEVIRDQEEFIRDAMSAGRTEAEVVASLGRPKDFADSLKLEYRVKKINEAPNLWSKYSEVIKSFGLLLALAPLNILLLFPLFVIVSFMFTWAFFSLQFIFYSSIATMVSFLSGIFMGFFSANYAFVVLLCLGSFFLSIASLILLYEVAKAIAKVFVVYVNWNLEVVKGR